MISKNKKYESLYFLAAISTIIENNLEISLSSGNILRFTLEEDTYIDANAAVSETKKLIVIKCTITNNDKQVFSIRFTKYGKAFCYRPIIELLELQNYQFKEKAAYIFAKETPNSRFVIVPFTMTFNNKKFPNIVGRISHSDMKEITNLATQKIASLEDKLTKVEKCRLVSNIEQKYGTQMVLQNRLVKYVRM